MEKQKDEMVSVEEMSRDLDLIHGKTEIEESIPYFYLEGGTCKVAIPVNIPIVKDFCKSIGLRNRSIFDLFGIKVGIDVKGEK